MPRIIIECRANGELLLRWIQDMVFMQKECFSYQVGIILLLKLQGHTILFNLNSEYIFKPNRNYSSTDSW